MVHPLETVAIAAVTWQPGLAEADLIEGDDPMLGRERIYLPTPGCKRLDPETRAVQQHHGGAASPIDAIGAGASSIDESPAIHALPPVPPIDKKTGALDRMPLPFGCQTSRRYRSKIPSAELETAGRRQNRTEGGSRMHPAIPRL